METAPPKQNVGMGGSWPEVGWRKVPWVYMGYETEDIPKEMGPPE